MILTLAMQKGGVGKTSSTRNLAAAFQQWGLKVLTCDLDGQASLTLSFGVDPATLEKTMFDLLTDNQVTAKDVIFTTDDGVDMIGANRNVSSTIVEQSIKSLLGRERILQRKLQAINNDYDVILIDTPPSLSLPTINGLVAADAVLIPVQPEAFCIYGLGELLTTIEEIRQEVNSRLDIAGMFFTLVDTRSKDHQSLMQSVRDSYDTLVLKHLIRRRVAVSSSSLDSSTVLTSKGKGRSGSNGDAASDYLALAAEVAGRIGLPIQATPVAEPKTKAVVRS